MQIALKLTPLVLLLLCLPACSGSRRTTAHQPPPQPDVRTEISVIPPQEIKGHGPFFGWQASFGESKAPALNEDALVPSTSPINSDGM